LRQNINGPVTEGDILFVEFRMRSVGGPGSVAAIFERAGAPFTKSLSQGIPAGDDWQRIQIAFAAAESYSAGQASFGFHLGYGEQTLQFTDFQVLNYGPPKTLAPETAFNLNNISGTHGVAQVVEVAGQPFTFAYEVETQNVPAQVWHLQAVERNEGVVASGNVMRFEFSVRATQGDNPRTGFVVQRTDNFATLFSRTIDLTSDWQNFQFDLPANANFGVNDLQAVFNLGYGLQTVELGGFHWTNQSNSVDLEDLPRQFPAASYLGRSGDDLWRSEANDRIEANRKSTVQIEVRDQDNQPLDGATVHLRQRNHDFLFGSAINAYGGKLDPNGNEQALKYQSEIKRLFNSVVLENSLKWPGFEQDRQRGLDGATFATENDLYLRGHNIIWPSRTFMPSSVWSEYDSRAASDGTAAANAWLKTTIENRFDDVLATFDGIVPEWDVVNEPWSNRDVMDLLGDNIVVEWFQRVRDFDPNIKLTLNDFGIFSNNGNNGGHRENFDYWLGLLNDANLLDVIGEQSHYSDASLTDITVLESLINEYHTEFNAPIAITEFDVNTRDEQLQADYLRDYMTMTFSLPAVTEFLHWGFWQDAHWLPDAALYRSDFSIKPNGQAYEDLVFGSWWTDAQATTSGGVVIQPAFLGDYDIVVQYAGQTVTGEVTVDATGQSSLVLNIDAAPVNFAPLLRSDSNSVTGNVGEPLTNAGLWRDPENHSIELTTSLGEVTRLDDGSWTWSWTPDGVYDNELVTITATDSEGAATVEEFSIDVVSVITERSVSYANSVFDPSAAVPGKQALLPGELATTTNYTNFAKGLNQIKFKEA
ncbi:MAG: endo-1,4-beta-xylanase, partial [Planctomycetota bacterium]